MQFLTSLFGGTGNTIITAVLALGIVLVLIILGLWLLKLLSKATSNASRGRVRRLSVIDTLPIDQKRQLLLIRRDNVDHLILIGGMQDVLVESGIPVEAPPTRAPLRRPPMTQVKPPQAAVAPTAPTAPAPAAPAMVPVNVMPVPEARNASIERLRDLGRPAGERKAQSLRHTGLMRPVSRMETAAYPANTDISGQPGSDSARSSQTDAATGHDGTTNGQADIGDGGANTGRNKGYPSDGN